MIYDLDSGGDFPCADRDVVVVGGGTVALLLASLLAKRGVGVLLLESGGMNLESGLHELNEATIEGRQHAGISMARARALGGTSNLWGGQLTPFVASDFLAREGIIDAAWPISYEEISRYYTVVAHELGLADDLTSESPLGNSILKNGFPYFSQVQIFFTRWLKQPNFADYFRQQLDAAPRLTVLLHAHVTRIRVDPRKGDVASVEVTHSDGRRTVVSGRRFVLANGTIEIARLLLISANREPTVPWASNQWVGRGFQDHLEFRAGRVILENPSRFLGYFQNVAIRGSKYQPKLRLSAGAAALPNALNVTGFFSFDSGVGEHLQHLKTLAKSVMRGSVPKDVGGLFRHLRGVGSVWLPLVMHYWRNHRIYSPADRGIWLTLHCEQLPLSDSCISLDLSRTDRFGSPLAALDWRIGGREEIRAMADFAHAVQSDFRESGIARIDIDASLASEESAVLDRVVDTYHQCGGARMGHAANDGVVDSDLKVFGTSNLYVAGAAVFRTSSYANPTFTALALTARLAERLAAETEAENVER